MSLFQNVVKYWFVIYGKYTTYIYKNVLAVCERVPLCPQISESGSPMALEFGHNVAGEYTRG
jgi:hypothetical protein